MTCASVYIMGMESKTCNIMTDYWVSMNCINTIVTLSTTALSNVRGEVSEVRVALLLI